MYASPGRVPSPFGGGQSPSKTDPISSSDKAEVQRRLPFLDADLAGCGLLLLGVFHERSVSSEVGRLGVVVAAKFHALLVGQHDLG